jgi:molybdopterin converting factor small subunit
MTTVLLPRSLVALFPEAPRRIELDDVATVGEAIDALDARWPGVRDRLVDAGPEIRAFINVYVDGEPAELGSTLDSRSVVHVLPAVAGG